MLPSLIFRWSCKEIREDAEVVVKEIEMGWQNPSRQSCKERYAAFFL